MLSKVDTLKGYRLHAIDGELGTIKEFFFDDQHWTVRYLVAETGNWLHERQVLISPLDLGLLNSQRQHIAVNLSKKQIADSPSLDTDKPVSRQFEESYHMFFGWPMYWDGANSWGNYPFLVQAREKGKTPPATGTSWNPFLRSTEDVAGHIIHATDGEIGHVEDFLIDPETWTIRYLVVDTRNWWEGRRVLVSPNWIGKIDWDSASVWVNLSREAIKASPEYTDGIELDREYESALHQHYNSMGYWDSERDAS